MIGLDTNVVLRYLLQDDPAQSASANRVFDHRLTEDDPGFISLVTMAEIVWVLRRSYKLSNTDTANAVERMLQADTLVIQNDSEVFAAMTVLRSGLGSFADALTGNVGVWAGCGTTLTFDKNAAELAEFDLV